MIGAAALRAAFGGPLPPAPHRADRCWRRLIAAAEPGLVASAGPRFFGFVVGGSLPAATAADMLAVGWDQIGVQRGVVSRRKCCRGGRRRLAEGAPRHPAGASVGFVTGAQAANTVGLATGRHAALEQAGWDVEQDGLAGAPRLRVLASIERHATIDRSLRLLGFGNKIVEPVLADTNGAIDIADLERVLHSQPAGPTVVCLQAGNVNTGACDDLRAAANW